GVRPTEGSRARRSTPEAPARRVRAQLPKRLSGRATVLGLLLIALGLAYAYPVRVLLAQQAQIDFMLESQNDQRARIAKLNSDLPKWNDDEYVRAQARLRLNRVRPGEVAYRIVGDVGASANASEQAKQSGSWYSQLWADIQAADDK